MSSEQTCCVPLHGPVSLSSRLELEGRFLLMPFVPVPQGFWSACVTAPISGSGFGLAFGTYGPYGIGSPCDFAHSQPLSANNEIDEFFTLYEQGVDNGFESVDVFIKLNFFDPAGNPLPVGFFYDVLPGDIPEAPPLILILLPGGLMIHRMLRGWPLPRDRAI